MLLIHLLTIPNQARELMVVELVQMFVPAVPDCVLTTNEEFACIVGTVLAHNGATGATDTVFTLETMFGTRTAPVGGSLENHRHLRFSRLLVTQLLRQSSFLSCICVVVNQLTRQVLKEVNGAIFVALATGTLVEHPCICDND